MTDPGTSKLLQKKQRLLLHCCCAPCASHVLELLVPVYECTVIFYNPNIEPFEEYEKRKKELNKLMARNSLLSGVSVIDVDYSNDVFTKAVNALRDESEGGVRCRVCFELRLRETAIYAAEGKFDIFTTTLSVSPHKNSALLNEIGSRLAEEYGIGYLVSDFKKQDGYKHSVELSEKYNLYRQDYCGCIQQSNDKI